MNLTDTGPVVALLDEDDDNHSACLAAARRLPAGALVTTWPCFSEAMYLLGESGGYRYQERLWQMRRTGRLDILELTAGRNLSVITYSDLARDVTFRLPNFRSGEPFKIDTFEWSGFERKLIGEFLGYISTRSYDRHGFMASALVVNQAQCFPSVHFFEWMETLGVLPDTAEDTVLKFWAEQLNKAHNWYKANRRV